MVFRPSAARCPLEKGYHDDMTAASGQKRIRNSLFGPESRAGLGRTRGERDRDYERRDHEQVHRRRPKIPPELLHLIVECPNEYGVKSYTSEYVECMRIGNGIYVCYESFVSKPGTSILNSFGFVLNV